MAISKTIGARWALLAITAAVVVVAITLVFATPRVERAAPRLDGGDDAGAVVELESLRGRVVAVLFFASWAEPSTIEAVALEGLRARLGDRGLEVIGVAEAPL